MSAEERASGEATHLQPLSARRRRLVEPLGVVFLDVVQQLRIAAVVWMAFSPGSYLLGPVAIPSATYVWARLNSVIADSDYSSHLSALRE